MEVPFESTGVMMPTQVDKQRYLGSVRFFKHMILFIIALLIILPIVFLIITYCKYRGLQGRYHNLETEYADYVRYAQELQTKQAERLYEMQEQISSSAKEAPHEQISDEEEAEIPFYVNPEAWNYILVNDTHPLSQSFQPMLAETRNGKQVDKRIKYQLEKMLDAAGEDGYELVVCSAYRNFSKQEELVDNSIRKYMKKGLDYETAFFNTKWQLEMTGCSEHHLGLAVDIVGVDYQSLDEKQADTEEAEWLKEHAYEYGFILRYPKDKEDITGIIQESWHFRYVGIEAATFMWENNLCLEEFLELAEEQ